MAGRSQATRAGRRGSGDLTMSSTQCCFHTHPELPPQGSLAPASSEHSGDSAEQMGLDSAGFLAQTPWGVVKAAVYK